MNKEQKAHRELWGVFSAATRSLEVAAGAIICRAFIPEAQVRIRKWAGPWTGQFAKITLSALLFEQK